MLFCEKMLVMLQDPKQSNESCQWSLGEELKNLVGCGDPEPGGRHGQGTLCLLGNGPDFSDTLLLGPCLLFRGCPALFGSSNLGTQDAVCTGLAHRAVKAARRRGELIDCSMCSETTEAVLLGHIGILLGLKIGGAPSQKRKGSVTVTHVSVVTQRKRLSCL